MVCASVSLLFSFVFHCTLCSLVLCHVCEGHALFGCAHFFLFALQHCFVFAFSMFALLLRVLLCIAHSHHESDLNAEIEFVPVVPVGQPSVCFVLHANTDMVACFCFSESCLLCLFFIVCGFSSCGSVTLALVSVSCVTGDGECWSPKVKLTMILEEESSLYMGVGPGGGVIPTQSGRFSSFSPISQKCRSGGGGGGVCYTFLKSPRNGRFGKVWVKGGGDSIFLRSGAELFGVLGFALFIPSACFVQCHTVCVVLLSCPLFVAQVHFYRCFCPPECHLNSK